jgi:hypothetical protein
MSYYNLINDTRPEKMSIAKKIYVIWQMRNIFVVVVIRRIISLILFILQLVCFSKYIMLHTEIKNSDDYAYEFVSQCNCTNFEIMNGTSSSIIESLKEPTQEYKLIIAENIIMFIVIIINDIHIARYVARNVESWSWNVLFSKNDKYSCLYLSITIMYSIILVMNIIGLDQSLKLKIYSNGDITGSAWTYACNSGYVPVQTNNNYPLNTYNETCAYEVAHVTTMWNPLNVYVYCINMYEPNNSSSIQALEIYQKYYPDVIQCTD